MPPCQQQVLDAALVQVQGLIQRRGHRKTLQRIQPQALLVERQRGGPRPVGQRHAPRSQMRQFIRHEIGEPARQRAGLLMPPQRHGFDHSSRHGIQTRLTNTQYVSPVMARFMWILTLVGFI